MKKVGLFLFNFLFFSLLINAQKINKEIEELYEELIPFHQNIFIFCKDKKCGLIDSRTGDILLKNNYDWISSYYESKGHYEELSAGCTNDIMAEQFVVKVNNYQGHLVYDDTRNYQPVLLKTNKATANKKKQRERPDNQSCTPLTWEIYRAPCKGYGIVSYNGKLNLIDKKGKLVSKSIAVDVGNKNPNDELALKAAIYNFPAIYKSYPYFEKLSTHVFLAKRENSYWVFNENGEPISTKRYTAVNHVKGVNNTAHKYVEETSYINIEDGEKKGIISLDGKGFLDAIYKEINPVFHEWGGQAFPMILIKENNLWGIYNLLGRQIITPPVFNNCKAVENNKIGVQYNGKGYYVLLQQQMQMREAEMFFNYFPYLLLEKNGNYIALNSAGEEVCTNYKIIEDKDTWSSGVIKITNTSKTQYGLYNPMNDALIKPQYDELVIITPKPLHYFAKVRKNNKWGLIYLDGRKHTKIKYDSIKQEKGEYRASKKRKKKVLFKNIK